jgi:hypothetical protein
MSKKITSGRDSDLKALREAERVQGLHPLIQKNHPSALPADPEKLRHINTYGSVPEFYIDQPFHCRQCGKWEIWKARDQKWYYEETKGHTDAKAVECHDCRTTKRGND